MTRAEDIRFAEDLGVDFIGFVLAPSSPRAVTVEQAAALRKGIQRAKTVGVFDDSDAERIDRTAGVLALDFIQLHGKPDIELCRSLSTPVIQAFWGMPPEDDLMRFSDYCSHILLDKMKGAQEADFGSIEAFPASLRSRMFLAGGLTPENVRGAVECIRPFAVDCARGIESKPGIKDTEKMRTFLQNLLP